MQIQIRTIVFLELRFFLRKMHWNNPQKYLSLYCVSERRAKFPPIFPQIFSAKETKNQRRESNVIRHLRHSMTALLAVQFVPSPSVGDGAEYSFREQSFKLWAQRVFWPHRVLRRELSEFLSAFFVCVPSRTHRAFSQNSLSLAQHSWVLSEPLLKQCSRNRIPPISYFGCRQDIFLHKHRLPEVASTIEEAPHPPDIHPTLRKCRFAGDMLYYPPSTGAKKSGKPGTSIFRVQRIPLEPLFHFLPSFSRERRFRPPVEGLQCHNSCSSFWGRKPLDELNNSHCRGWAVAETCPLLPYQESWFKTHNQPFRMRSLSRHMHRQYDKKNKKKMKKIRTKRRRQKERRKKEREVKKNKIEKWWKKERKKRQDKKNKKRK